MTTYIVTAKGVGVLKFGDAPLQEGQPVPAEDWDTRVSLAAQGLILYVPDALVKGGVSLPDDFPYKGVLERHGFRSIETVHYLTDRQLIALPVIGEAAVTVIRAFVAQQRGEEPRSYADDLATLHEVGHVAYWYSEDMDTPALERPEDYVVLVADRGNMAAAVAAIRAHMLTEQEQVILQLADPDFDPASILAEMRYEDGSYKLSEPLTLLLERLGLTYPPPVPAVPAEGEVPPPAELEHPASDPEKDAETVKPEVTGESVQTKGEEVKKEEKAASSRGKAASKPKG